MKHVNFSIKQYALFLITCIVMVSLGFILLIRWNSVRLRQDAVRLKGSQIMPFDLNKTTHVFKPLDNGGLQQVIAKNPYDKESILLIQQHLQKEAERFQKGDYSDPAFIHGINMVGLSSLSQASGKIIITFVVLPNGAQITYLSQDPQLVTAIHDWFIAQTMDHGHDAMMQ